MRLVQKAPCATFSKMELIAVPPFCQPRQNGHQKSPWVRRIPYSGRRTSQGQIKHDSGKSLSCIHCMLISAKKSTTSPHKSGISVSKSNGHQKNAGNLPDVTDYSLLLMFFKHICNVDDIQRMQPPDFVNHIAVLKL